MRKNYTWRLSRSSVELGTRTVIMGILNLTPDSFSDGGLYDDPPRALDRALKIEAEGADILDLGGQSTRPGSEAVSEDLESRRVMPCLEHIAAAVKIPVSIDTYHAGLARRAIEAGAQIINDISGFRLDAEMATVVSETRVGVVLMHSRGKRDAIHTLRGQESPEAIRRELERTLDGALGHGVAPEAIVADPGIGFSKDRTANLKVLKSLSLFSTLGYPLLVGPSRKSFIHVDMRVPDAVDWGTAAAVALAAAGGAHIVRVHAVARMRAVADVADSILNA